MFDEHSVSTLNRILHNDGSNENVYGVIEMPNGLIAVAHGGMCKGIDKFMSIMQYDRFAAMGAFTSIYKVRKSVANHTIAAMEISALDNFKGAPADEINAKQAERSLRNKLAALGHYPKKLDAHIDGNRIVVDTDSATRAIMRDNKMIG